MNDTSGARPWPRSGFHSMWQMLQRTAAGQRRLFGDEPLADLVSVMTVTLLLLHFDGIRQIEETVVILSVTGILMRGLLRRPAFWFGLTALLTTNHVLLWQTLDNHQYLVTYWCFATGLCRLLPDSSVALARNARLLIGLCFLFATVWKLISPEFIDGSFFHFTLLTDRRFSGFADLVGGVPASITDANNAALRGLATSAGDVVQLQDAPRVALLARVMAFWTIAIEGSIALLFLMPDRVRWSTARDAVLLLFMLSTYPIASVVGFGRLLSVMGLAQSRNRLGFERILLLASFILMPVYRFLFSGVIRILIE